MSEHSANADSSTHRSNGHNPPTQLVRSYVRSRPGGDARVTFAPSDPVPVPASLSSASEVDVHLRRADRPRPRSRRRSRHRDSPAIRIPIHAGGYSSSDSGSPGYGDSARPHVYISNDYDGRITISPESTASERDSSAGALGAAASRLVSSLPRRRIHSGESDSSTFSTSNTSRKPKQRILYDRQDDSDISASEAPVSLNRHSSPSRRQIRPRERDISTFATSTNSRAPKQILRIYDDFADDSDDERIKVHHVINVRLSRSVAQRGDQEQKWLGSRVFTHQSLLNQHEKAFQETYHIVQSRLVPRSEDYVHDRAILMYEKNATSKAEIRWVYDCPCIFLDAV